MGVNKHIVWNERLKKLPEFEPEEKLWAKIEAELDFEQKLYVAIDQLPSFEPEEILWEKMGEKLVSPKIKHIALVRWGIAASISVAVSLSIFFYKNTSNSKLIIETEFVSNDKEMKSTSTSDVEMQALLLIQQLCETNSTVCQGEVFKEKISLYNELQEEESRLQQTISFIGESPEIVKALIRIENMKSKTIQELVTLMNS